MENQTFGNNDKSDNLEIIENPEGPENIIPNQDTNKIKSLLDSRFLYSQINQLKSKDESISLQEVFTHIESTGLIDDVLTTLNNPSITKTPFYNFKPSPSQLKSKNNESNNLCLLLQLDKGSEFVDYTITKNNLSFSNTEKSNIYFIFDINFLNQNRQSLPVPINNEFNINQAFAFDLNPEEKDIDLQSISNTLLAINDPIHIVILLCDGVTKKKKVISSKSIEWRWCLGSNFITQSFDFKSISNLNKNELGKIQMTISINPVSKIQPCTLRIIKDKINQDRSIEIEKIQSYINYSSQWWEEYKETGCSNINPNSTNSISSRIIKLFMQTEDKENYSYKPFCSLIHPISSRRINTPYEAGRYVSLIPCEAKENLTGEKIEMWYTLHTFLAAGKGNVCDHVLLLCNLLLGFGLDAYIACGFSVDGEHCWVITRNQNTNNALNKNNEDNFVVTYWESLSGFRINSDNINIANYYSNIHCVFNHENFYANLQKDDNPFSTNYNFEQNNLWKKMNKDVIVKVPKFFIDPDLDVINIDVFKEEVGIENLIKNIICQWRNNKDLSTNYDQMISNLLAPSLVNYEIEKINCVGYNDINDEFKDLIKNYIKKGFKFSAYPFHVNDISESSISNKILNNSLCKQIIDTTGDQVTFGVRCKLYTYPVGIYSLWGVIGVKYKSI